MTIRTAQIEPVQSKHTGKFACQFQTFATLDGEEHLMSELCTGHVWFDREAALKAGERALQILAETGKYPNLCEIW